MNLNEIYETLKQRGMPEHPRLKFAHGQWFIVVCKADDPWELIDDDDDARDLLTLHALRWAECRLPLCFAKTTGGADVTVTAEWPEPQPMGRTLIHCTEWSHVLDAIIAATAHLQPKEPQ